MNRKSECSGAFSLQFQPPRISEIIDDKFQEISFAESETAGDTSSLIVTYYHTNKILGYLFVKSTLETFTKFRFVLILIYYSIYVLVDKFNAAFIFQAEEFDKRKFDTTNFVKHVSRKLNRYSV